MEILKVEAGLIIWEIVAFGGLLLVLWRFAWGPLLGILDQREDTIRESVEKAEQTRVKAEELMEDYKKQLAEAHADSQKIIEQGRKFGDSMKEDIVAKARQESEQLLARAAADIEHQKELAVAQLQKQVADLTVGAASQVLGRSLDKKGHEQLIEQYLAEASGLREN
jgi:F-type H+-transporting ATPase subunit b